MWRNVSNVAAEKAYRNSIEKLVTVITTENLNRETISKEATGTVPVEDFENNQVQRNIDRITCIHHTWVDEGIGKLP